MKKLLTITLLTGLVSTSFAREPFMAPLAPEAVVFQGEQYSPTPVEQVAPRVNIVPVQQQHFIPANPGYAPLLPPPQYGAPQYAAPPLYSGSAVYPNEPGVIVCDSCSPPPMPLCTNVRVLQARNIHPLAVRKIVSVPDPLNKCNCVFIEICVPPCGCEHIDYNRRGNSVKFDYGKYAVNVTARRGLLFVNYDD